MFLFSFISPKIISIFILEIVSIHYNFLKTKYPSSFQLIPSNVLPKAYPFSCNIDRSCHRKQVVNNKQLRGCRLFLFALYYKIQAPARLNITVIPQKQHSLTLFRLLWNQDPQYLFPSTQHKVIFLSAHRSSLWNSLNSMAELNCFKSLSLDSSRRQIMTTTLGSFLFACYWNRSLNSWVHEVKLFSIKEYQKSVLKEKKRKKREQIFYIQSQESCS